MLGIKRISDFTFKNHDIDTLKVQLLRDGQPFTIPYGSTVTLLVSSGILVFEEPLVIEDYKNGIVSITINTTEFGVGDFKCEYVLTNEGVHLTFPDNGFDSISIKPSLKDRK